MRKWKIGGRIRISGICSSVEGGGDFPRDESSRDHLRHPHWAGAPTHRSSTERRRREKNLSNFFFSLPSLSLSLLKRKENLSVSQSCPGASCWLTSPQAVRASVTYEKWVSAGRTGFPVHRDHLKGYLHGLGPRGSPLKVIQFDLKVWTRAASSWVAITTTAEVSSWTVSLRSVVIIPSLLFLIRFFRLEI